MQTEQDKALENLEQTDSVKSEEAKLEPASAEEKRKLEMMKSVSQSLQLIHHMTFKKVLDKINPKKGHKMVLNQRGQIMFLADWILHAFHSTYLCCKQIPGGEEHLVKFINGSLIRYGYEIRRLSNEQKEETGSQESPENK